MHPFAKLFNINGNQVLVVARHSPAGIPHLLEITYQYQGVRSRYQYCRVQEYKTRQERDKKFEEFDEIKAKEYIK